MPKLLGSCDSTLFVWMNCRERTVLKPHAPSRALYILIHAPYLVTLRVDAACQVPFLFLFYRFLCFLFLFSGFIVFVLLYIPTMVGGKDHLLVLYEDPANP